MYWDEECAKMILEFPLFPDSTMFESALEVGNLTTLFVLKEPETPIADFMKPSFNDKERVRLLVKLLKMVPDLADLVNGKDLLALSAYYGMLDELMYLR